MKIKTNDKVKILSGKDRGKVGKVMQVFVEENKIVVDGVNKIKKHIRPQKQGEKGQILELFGPINVSKAMLVCAKCDKPIRVGYKFEAGKKRRVCRACNQFID